MRALVASFGAALALAAPLARAESVEQAAQAHLDRGVAAFREGDYAAAHRAFLAAHELVPDKPNPHRWLALTEVQLGDCHDALIHIDGFLSRVPPDDARRAELVRLRELCERTGVLAVRSTPPGAQLRLDGMIVGATPFRALSMRAGAHVVVAEKPGYASASRSIVVPAAGELDVHLALSPERASITRRWWFWTVVAGAAVAVAGVGYYATRDPGDAQLPPITCGPMGCRPGGS